MPHSFKRDGLGRRPFPVPLWRTGGGLALAFALAACSLAPRTTQGERDRLAQAGKPYQAQAKDRDLPKLPAQPSWRQVLRRAFLANGALEAAYFDWNAGVQAVDAASAWPAANAKLGFGYMFSDARMKSFDRTTVSLGNDLTYPGKTRQAGQVALDAAMAAGERFRQAKFDLQQKTLSAFADHVFLAEKLRLLHEDLALLKQARDAAQARVSAGGDQRDLLRAQVDLRMGEDAIQSARAQAVGVRAALNGLLALAPESPLGAPDVFPPPRPLVADDARILAAGVDRNPELAALAKQAAGRADALVLARQQWIPDFSLSASVTGDISQALGAGLSLPTAIPRIRASIREARAMLRGSEAQLRQAKFDRTARFVATLAALRDDERQAALFEGDILPAAKRIAADALAAYAAGRGDYTDLVAARRVLLQVRLTAAQARTEREKRLAELEALAGVDMETLAPPAQTAPQSNPNQESPHAPAR